MKFLLPFILIMFLIMSGCFYDSEEYLYPQINNDCDTTNVTFSLSVKPILSGSCLSCHSNSTAASFGGNIKLEDYVDVKQRADDGTLIGSIKRTSGFSPMPKGSSKLEDCKITIIQIWIDAGALNN